MKSEEFEAIMKEVNNIAESKRVIQESLLSIFTSKELDLHERWEIYSRSIETFVYFSESRWVLRFDFFEELDLTWYDDFYMDRHASRDLTEIYDTLFESLAYQVDEGIITNERLHEILPKVQEELMPSGYSHMTNDW